MPTKAGKMTAPEKRAAAAKAFEATLVEEAIGTVLDERDRVTGYWLGDEYKGFIVVPYAHSDGNVGWTLFKAVTKVSGFGQPEPVQEDEEVLQDGEVGVETMIDANVRLQELEWML
jgi:hypothetical protein